MSARFAALAFCATVLLVATGVTAASAALPRALTRHTLTCHQTYASYAPNGRLDHYGESASWTVRLQPDGKRYEAAGDGIDAGSGAMAYRRGKLTFADGPFHDRKAGWVLLGRYVKRGARMPHDPRKGRTFPFVLRSKNKRHADLAPPHTEKNEIALSFFYCR
jgi:hypothetical protein